MSSHDIGATNNANNTISEYQPPSILQLLKAGQLIENVSNAVDLNSFDLTTSSWTMAQKRATFNISRIRFAYGSFRDAHKATVIQGAETVKYWLDEVYRDEIAATIENDMGLTIDQHTRKQVQLHEIARFLCAQFAASAPASIGATFSLNRIFHSTYNQKPVTLEAKFFFLPWFCRFITSHPVSRSLLFILRSQFDLIRSVCRQIGMMVLGKIKLDFSYV